MPWSEVVYRSDRDKSEEREKGSKVKKLSTVIEVGRITIEDLLIIPDHPIPRSGVEVRERRKTKLMPQRRRW